MTFKRQKIDFDQRMACGAPLRWSKYTTALVERSLTIGFSVLQYRVIGVGTWSCCFYKNLVILFALAILRHKVSLKAVLLAPKVKSASH